MDAKYHKAANAVSGCEANPNLDILMKYKNDLGKPATSMVGFLMGPRTLTLVPSINTTFATEL